MKTKRVVLAVAILVIVVVASAAYYLMLPKAPVAATIKVGVVGELTGPWAYSGTSVLDGIRFAVKETNQAGGVLGRNLELVVGDSKSDPKEAVTLFRKMVESDKVAAMIAGISSDVSIAIRGEANQEKIPTMLLFAASAAVHTKDTRYVFRSPVQLAPPVMQALVAYFNSKGYVRVGLLIADYAFGRSVEASLRSALGNSTTFQLSVQAASVPETNFVPILRKLQDFNPDVVVVAHPPGGVAAIKQMIDMGMDKTEVITAYAADWSEVWRGLGKDLFRIRVVDGWSYFDPNNPDYVKVAERFRNDTGKYMDKGTVAGYIQVKVLSAAIQNANSLDPAKITDALNQISYQSFIAFPMSYVPWGEFKAQRVVFATIKPGAPPGAVNPGVEWHPEAIYISPPLTPYTPA